MANTAVGILSGYLHPAYAEALSEYGQPVLLPRSRGWVLERAVPGRAARDAVGCYPLFLCQDWSSLHTDLELLERDWITVALVADPFGDHTAAYLESCFPDELFPFKEHFVVDLSIPARRFVSRHHARNARRALQKVTVELCPEPSSFLEDWVDLYDVLSERHNIRGMAAFSRRAFARQMQVPGLVAFRAAAEDSTVGMLLWYVTDKTAYYHLGAYNETGYDLRASFALFSTAIDYFAQSGLSWLNLGAGAGTRQTTADAARDGLSRFKKGWSSGTRTAYFCGRILDKTRYAEMAPEKDGAGIPFFPAYRAGGAVPDADSKRTARSASSVMTDDRSQSI